MRSLLTTEHLGERCDGLRQQWTVLVGNVADGPSWDRQVVPWIPPLDPASGALPFSQASLHPKEVVGGAPLALRPKDVGGAAQPARHREEVVGGPSSSP